ncbi:MAG: NirD/YgiW/YdeI family stress tolerance protein [Burkholderiales bacterium]|nr:NirD/YgiW/YdeI family stress tolerance protein [Burkholderiales bacterium]
MKKIIAVMLLLGAMPAFAQFGSPAEKASVKSILAAPNDGHRVVLRGTIVSDNGDESYLFTDGTGQISLAIENRLLWGQKLVKGTPVEIEGEVDEHWFSDVIDISVERVQVMKQGSAAADNLKSGG